MKIFSILALGVALMACVPSASKSNAVSHGFPVGTNEVWNLKILDKAGATLIDENFKLDGGYRSWVQTQALSSGSGTVLYTANNVYEVGLLKFALLPVYSADIGRIRSEKRTGVIAHYFYRDEGSEYYEVFSDINKTKPNQDVCSLGFKDSSHLQGRSYRYLDETTSNQQDVGICSFTKLEPAPK
jgi:hypothetical protein